MVSSASFSDSVQSSQTPSALQSSMASLYQEVTSTSEASSIYGPVHSWRVGWSLGVDLLLTSSICSFNCVYCQLGDIQTKTQERKIYVPTNKIERDLRISDWEKADIITLSGNGEPTLALNLEEVIAMIKEYTQGKKVMVLTNATMLHLPEVRRSLRLADIVACKLDAATETVLQRMNRPVAGITLERILSGIEAFRAEYTGTLALQCMFMPTNLEDYQGIATLAKRLRPDEIQLNTPKRPYPLTWVVDNRGNHTEIAYTETRQLRTVDELTAEHIEHALKESFETSDTCPKLHSIYSKSS
ncbi:MAG: radical SAM protein [Vampirovibrionales bacterium]